MFHLVLNTTVPHPFDEIILNCSMLSKKNKQDLRSILFYHLDGIATAPTAFALHEKGVLQYLLDKKEATLQEITARFESNEGYLNVALRILCSQGWLIQYIDNDQDIIKYSLSDLSEIAFSHFHLYADVVHLLKFSEQFHPRKFEIEPFRVLEKIFEKYRNNYGIKFSKDEKTNRVQQHVLRHIEGIIVGPTIVHLGMGGMFHKYFMETSFKPEEFHNDPENFGRLLNIFVHLGWFTESNGTYRFTEVGLFFAKRASAYGVTVSYIPTFRKLDELIFGDPNIVREVGAGVPERHVDREMNVWGSGGAHSGYFKVIDKIIIDLFNRPINEQPKGILDVGCGNGALLQHLFEVISYQTERGKQLDDYPLFLIGADYNDAALKATRANLVKADIWAKVIWGDIGRPDVLAQIMVNDYGIEMADVLNVRTFLDHNRNWKEPGVRNKTMKSRSTGAFAYQGARIGNNLIEDTLFEHFKNWEPFVGRFGLLIVELHTVPPALSASNLGKTASTAYDATHGYSDQYIVEVDVFNKVAAEAGLYPDPDVFRKFPDSDLATVTINLLKGRTN